MRFGQKSGEWRACGCGASYTLGGRNYYDRRLWVKSRTDSTFISRRISYTATLSFSFHKTFRKFESNEPHSLHND